MLEALITFLVGWVGWSQLIDGILGILLGVPT